MAFSTTHDADFYSAQHIKTCPLFLRLPYLNVTISVFLLSKGIAGSHQVYMKTNLRHQTWKHLTLKTGIPVPAPDKREVGVLRQSFLLPKGNIFIFAHSFLEFDEDTLNVCCLNPMSKKQCYKAE